MIDLAAYARRIRTRAILAGVLFFGGALMMVVDFTTKLPTIEKGAFAFVWAFIMGVGGFFYVRSLELPGKEIMQLAETHNGLLTVTEITTALNISPAVAQRALHYLLRQGLAKPSFQDLDKNLWEFPDSIRLPLGQALAHAQAHQGRIALSDLVAEGHSMAVAEQTFAVLTEKGLAREDPGADTRALLLARQ